MSLKLVHWFHIGDIFIFVDNSIYYYIRYISPLRRAVLQENFNDEHCIQENRLFDHRVGVDRRRRSRGGGHGGRGHVHQELRAVQENVGCLLRGAAVCRRLRQVQG